MGRFFVIALLVLGVAGWLTIFGGYQPALIVFGPWGPGALLSFGVAVAVVGWVPLLAGPVDSAMNWLRHPTMATRNVCSLVVAVISGVYLWLTAVVEHRQFFPYIHDEFSYLIQAHQFAVGHLWMPAHPLGKFFESFQLFVQPVYASAYFPGTALLYVPGIWLHLQPFVESLMISGAVAGLLFWITTELLDGVAGWLSWLLLLSDGTYRQLSILTLGQMPLLLYGLAGVWVWLRWRSSQQYRWAVATGMFLGLACITRPVDALCFVIPIGIDFAVRSPKQIALVLAGAVPFVCLQLVLNHGITGSWWQTPFTLYANQEYPGTSYGFHPFNTSMMPTSDLPQIRALYGEYQPLIANHQEGMVLSELLHVRLRLIASQCAVAPFPVLILLLPLSLLGLNRQRATFLAVLPLFLFLYGFYVFFFPHYVMTTAPMVIAGILTGAEMLTRIWPSARRFTAVALTLFIGGNAIAALPQWSASSEDVFRADLLSSVNRQIAANIHEPAVVLFKFDPARNIHEEPVYNADVAWPDDAQIIRANDLGPGNAALFDYYGRVAPDRVFYRFDEVNKSLTRLGNYKQLRSEAKPFESAK